MSQRRSSSQQLHGVLLLNKPQGPTSTACLEQIKRRLGQKKIGHAGTLDPNAQGLLIVLLGQATKLAPYLGQGAKTYAGSCRLGLETDSYDMQGRVVARHSLNGVDPELIREEIQNWTQLTEQSVPPVSAAKYKGQPLYARKRQGRYVPEKSKQISIDQTAVLELELPYVSFRVVCSKGTYIRSLAHSLGKRLGCGAVLSELVREKSEPFELAQAFPLQDILDQPGQLHDRVCSIQDSLPEWPRIRLDERRTLEIKNGLWLPTDQVDSGRPATTGDQSLLLNPDGEPVALAEVKDKGHVPHWTVLRGLWS